MESKWTSVIRWPPVPREERVRRQISLSKSLSSLLFVLSYMMPWSHNHQLQDQTPCPSLPNDKERTKHPHSDTILQINTHMITHTYMKKVKTIIRLFVCRPGQIEADKKQQWRPFQSRLLVPEDKTTSIKLKYSLTDLVSTPSTST